MPELPEVETVKCGLELILGHDAIIDSIEIIDSKLRFPVPNKAKILSKNQRLKSLSRRAKYIIFELDDLYLCSHLGMTGTWRIDEGRKKHDHVKINFKNKETIVYNDPRKFGLFEYFLKGEKYHRFNHLGPEPLEDEFNEDYLWGKIKNRSTSIKNLIMDQKVVVGVGNIYAVESLFATGIRPTKKAKYVTKKQLSCLVEEIKNVLDKAIKSGGSTISDFKQAGGESGYFQHEFKVYGREGEECFACKSILKNTIIGGRASVWCPACQK